MRRALAGVIVLAACSAPAVRQEGPEPVRGTVTIGGTAVEVDALYTRALREGAFAARNARDYRTAFLLAYPRDRFQHVHNTGVHAPFQAVFFTREGEVVGEARLAEDEEEGATSEREAAYVLVIPVRSAAEVRIPRGARAELSENLRSLETEDNVELPVGSASVHVEIVTTVERRSRGLMFRPRVSEDDGMLFCYANESTRRFWMRNTRIPLSIAYVRADGTIGHIVERMEPMDETPVPSRVPAKYVLEVNVGWFDRHGVHEGDRVGIPDGLEGEE